MALAYLLAELARDVSADKGPVQRHYPSRGIHNVFLRDGILTVGEYDAEGWDPREHVAVFAHGVAFNTEKGIYTHQYGVGNGDRRDILCGSLIVPKHPSGKLIHLYRKSPEELRDYQKIIRKDPSLKGVKPPEDLREFLDAAQRVVGRSMQDTYGLEPLTPVEFVGGIYDRVPGEHMRRLHLVFTTRVSGKEPLNLWEDENPWRSAEEILARPGAYARAGRKLLRALKNHPGWAFEATPI